MFFLCFVIQAPKGPDVTELVKHVERDLKKCCKHSKNGICLFEFVLHPTSFSETVRHLFLTSFLVKEKKASIVMKEPNKPRIYYGESGGQLIFTINKSQWTKMVMIRQKERESKTMRTENITVSFQKLQIYTQFSQFVVI